MANKSNVIRCGVIGVGRMGRHHARVYAQTDGAELVGVVDQDPERADAIVTTSGVSCRHQVRDGTGRTAVHPIELLAAWLTDRPA